jgi:hypothetical protein
MYKSCQYFKDAPPSFGPLLRTQQTIATEAEILLQPFNIQALNARQGSTNTANQALFLSLRHTLGLTGCC